MAFLDGPEGSSYVGLLQPTGSGFPQLPCPLVLPSVQRINENKTVASNQKTHGVYYTPEPVVRYLVHHTMAPLLHERGSSDRQPLRVLDPACGDGVFLAEAYRYLLEKQLGPDPTRGSVLPSGRSAPARRQQHWRNSRLTHQIFGIDIDAAALRAARERLARIALSTDIPDTRQARCRTTLVKRLGKNLHWGDALLDADAPRRDAWARRLARDWKALFRQVFQGANPGFDAVIGNPPYVNIRILSQTRSPELRQYFARRYQCAARAYDLYVLFIERAFELLRVGGRCGMIVPNKIAASDYARPCRALLLERTSLVEIVDVAELRLFAGAAVYPYLVIWEKRPASSRHRVSLVNARLDGARIRPAHKVSVPQQRLLAAGSLSVRQSLDVEARTATVPLAKCGEIHCGTTGFAGHALACWLIENDEARRGTGYDFIVSGNIDRYRIQCGAVRFMSKHWRRPVLRADCPLLSPRKRSLFAEPKIVVSGMSRRLEAAWDGTGLALGVQVFAVAHVEDPWYLLGLLNSRLMTYLFHTRFEARRLGGGFLSVHKGQLAQLPIRVTGPHDTDDVRTRQEIVRLAQLQTSLAATASPASDAQRAQADQELDGQVYRLYELTDREVEHVEQSVVSGG